MEPTLIAEIGGSSSRWAYLPTDGPEVLLPVKGDRMPGFNPVAGDAEGFIAGVRAQVVQHCPAAFGARRLFVYGAGCGAADRQLRMQQVLAPLFPSAVVDVQSDLDGAALGLCGSGPGLVLILGTGMTMVEPCIAPCPRWAISWVMKAAAPIWAVRCCRTSSTAACRRTPPSRSLDLTGWLWNGSLRRCTDQQRLRGP
ncbi:MAG: hypothetical protein MUE88_08710 [Flavobacteriales bacterium]|nr:hypothetical protein [Flavobacteriales bacterium]